MTEGTPTKKRSRRWRVVLALLAVPIALVAGPTAWAAWYGRAAEAETAGAAAGLDGDDPGWRLDEILAARADVPDAENGARVVLEARAAMGGTPPAELVQLLDRVGTEAAAEGELQGLIDWLDRDGSIGTARRVADMPRGRLPLEVDPDAPNTVPLADRAALQDVAELLRADGLRAALTGRPDDALCAARAVLRVGSAVGDEPFVLSNMVRLFCRARAVRAAEAALSRGEPSAGELKSLEAALAAEENDPTYRRLVRGHRAVTFAVLRAVAEGRCRPADGRIVLRGVWRYEAASLGFFAPRLLAGETAALLRHGTAWLAATALPEHEQLAAEEELWAAGNRKIVDGYGAFSLASDPRQIGSASRRSSAQLRALRACLAAEMYRREKGAWPADLAALVPAYLGAVPADPFDGKPMRYRRDGDGIAVYSVDRNLADDGGNFVVPEFDTDAPDVGVRLRGPEERRRLKAADAATPTEGK